MREHKIAAIPGDGIGKEVIAAGLAVLDTLVQRDGGFRLAVEQFPWGSDYYRAQGCFMPEDGLDRLRGFGAIFFGAVGDPQIPDHVTLWGLRLPICQGLDQYANVRPARLLPGIASPLRDCGPGDLDWVIVRENSEGEYAGHGGRVHRGLPEEVATETAVFTRAGVSRIMRFAFALARQRPRRHLPGRRHHEAVPGGGRQRAARHLVHRRVVVVAEPHPGDEVGGIADKPGVAVILGRPGLAGDRPRQRGASSGAVIDDPAQHRIHCPG